MGEQLASLIAVAFMAGVFAGWFYRVNR